MRRIFWMAVGAGVTIYAMRRSKAGLAALLPPALSRALCWAAGSRRRGAGLAGSASRAGKHAANPVVDDLAAATEEFLTDFRAARSAREAELRTAVLTQRDPGSSGGGRASITGLNPSAPGTGPYGASGAVPHRGRAAARDQDLTAYDYDAPDADTDPEEPIHEFESPDRHPRTPCRPLKFGAAG